MFTREGRPYMANTGRTQRVRRRYSVEGREPRTTLSCRDCQDGTRLWTVEVLVNETECERRAAAECEKWENDMRARVRRRQEIAAEHARAQNLAAPTVATLRRRYSDLTINGEINERDVGGRWQVLTFATRSLQALVGHGLVTNEMLEAPNGQGELRSGTWFGISRGRDGGGEYFCLTLRTDEQPRERKRFPVAEARELLGRIAERAR